MRTYLENIAA